MKTLGPRVRVVQATAQEGYKMHLVFENGVEKVVDLAPYLNGPIFEPLKQNADLFKQVKIEGGTIAWDNGADIDPDVLYYELTPAWLDGRVRSCLTPKSSHTTSDGRLMPN